MLGAAAFRAALEAGDFRQLRRISEQAEPHLPRLTDDQAEIVMHDARTRARSMPLWKRLWSHRWLSERGHESGLPDRLRPSAEQVTPRIVAAVGISVKTTSAIIAPAAEAIRNEMELAVKEADADGRLEDSPFVRARILEARARALRQLVGIREGTVHG
jgi:hypothetical protein